MWCLKVLLIRLDRYGFLVILGKLFFICVNFYLFNMGMMIYIFFDERVVYKFILCCGLLKSFY